VSTKIYNGLRFTCDIFELHEHLTVWSRRIAAETKELAGAFVVRRAVAWMDLVALGIPTDDLPKTSYLTGAASDLRTRYEKLKQPYPSSDPAVDFTFDVTIHPVEGRLYGMVFAGQNEWRRSFIEQPFVEAYGYWNNSDGPEDVSEADWLERKRIWDLALPSEFGAIPARCGLSAQLGVSFIRSLLPTDFPAILKYVPEPQHRAWEALDGQSFGDFASGNGDTANGTTYTNWLRWLKTPEGEADKERRLAEAIPNLPEITLEKLLQPPPQPTPV
jgi:hypothetical protein